MPQADQTNPECRLTAAQYCLQWGAPEKVIFSGRVQQNGGKMGRKWVHFPAEWSLGTCSQSLLSPPALVTGLRVKTIERCESGFE